MEHKSMTDTSTEAPSRVFMPAGWDGYDMTIAVCEQSELDDLEYIRADIVAAERDALRAEVTEQRGYKDGAYEERNRLVALLCRLFPSGRKRTAIEGWSDDWHGCVYIDFPWGQASWHYHDSQEYLFAHVEPYLGEWDGHTTSEKYDAIALAGLFELTSLADRDAEIARLKAKLAEGER